jgi:hypothetical protein
VIRHAWRSGTAVALCALAACGGADPISPADALSVRVESQHLVYFSSPGDQVDTAWMESYWDFLTGQLGESSRKLEYYKYRDRAHITRVTGRATNGFAEPGTPRFHSIWPIDNHEIVHALVILEIGHPTALFNEGVAVAHQMLPAQGVFYAQWNGVNVHIIAARERAAGHIPAVAAVLESPAFFARGEALMYPLAGSFVRWLIDTHGLATFRGVLESAAFGDPAFITATRFSRAYGFPIEQAWSQWQLFLASY